MLRFYVTESLMRVYAWKLCDRILFDIGKEINDLLVEDEF